MNYNDLKEDDFKNLSSSEMLTYLETLRTEYERRLSLLKRKSSRMQIVADLAGLDQNIAMITEICEQESNPTDD